MIEVMKVYLDYQLWDYINKNDNPLFEKRRKRVEIFY